MILSSLTTEAINPRTAEIDLLDTRQIIELLHQEDQLVDNAVGFVLGQVSTAADMLVKTVQSGKRMAYVGAGTSGRLGVLDASELPPTYGADPDLVVGIIAGGAAALVRSIEGAEDNPLDGGKAIHEENARDVRPLGMVVGLSASGRTPFVLGALKEAHRLDMYTVLISTNDEDVVRSQVPFADLLICPPVGPEPIAGSTRMKSGTAQKMIVNMITTSAMVRIGKTYGNVMVDVQPTNEKLRDRAVRIVSLLGNVGTNESRHLLEVCSWRVKTAIVMAARGCDFAEAEAMLQAAGGRVRAVLEHTP